MRLNRLSIKKPLISEKATDLSQKDQYVFMIAKDANKNEVKRLVGEIYDVTVKKVNIIRVKSKGEHYKKAIVTLKEGDKIDIVPH